MADWFHLPEVNEVVLDVTGLTDREISAEEAEIARYFTLAGGVKINFDAGREFWAYLGAFERDNG